MKWLAYRLPKRICYWVLIRVGSMIGTTMLRDEEVPAVPFTVVLERFSKTLKENHR